MADTAASFQQALPIWKKGQETEKHLRMQFKAVCSGGDGAAYCLRLTGYSVYHVNVNGVFVAYGPARAGRGSFRVDELELTPYMTRAQNVILIEVCGYNVNAYVMPSQPSFVQAEILRNGEAVCWTGRDFTARVHPFYRRKTQRYSFQRPMVEAYRVTRADDFAQNPATVGDEPLEQTETKRLLPRLAPYPQYERLEATPLFSGTFTFFEPEHYKRDGSCTNIGPALGGFPREELEVCATDECQRMRFEPSDKPATAQLKAGAYTVYRLPYNASGMATLTVECAEPTTLYLLFDEILKDNRVDFLRMDCANAIRFDLCKGRHTLQLFEVYTMQLMQFTVASGRCEVQALGMIEYKHPPVPALRQTLSPTLQKIADAAVETFRQNAVDIFMDCPSRERAGWLCDSFFTARTEYCLTGGSAIERSFLENFLHEECYAHLPDGMLPMCYPADHNDGTFIPNWAMWLVLELTEYRQRTGDRELVERFRHKLYALLAYFRRFENEDGLLEKLESWVFVEWSKANELVQDINYPSNMLYVAMLRCMETLYGDSELGKKAAHIQQEILRQSFNGQFFVDNARRQGEQLIATGEITEVCQYFAFFCRIATPETHPELFRTLVEDFGPERQKTGKWPAIYPAAPFIGQYLRLEILMRYGYKEKVQENIEGFFLYMAQTTGTLWEHAQVCASCNHGFASHVLYWLSQM